MNLKPLVLFLSLVSAYPVSYNNLNCSGSIYPTPTYGLDGAVFSVCATNDIHGTFQQVYYTLLDFRHYKQWNTFVYEAEVPDNVTSAASVYVGMPMTFHTTGVVPNVNSTSVDVISNLKKPYYITWTNDDLKTVVGYLEHVNLLLPVRRRVTKYISFETHYGLARVLLPYQANLQRQFEAQGRNLKSRVEGN